MTFKFRNCLAGALVGAVLVAGLPATAADQLRLGATFITSGVDPAKGSNGWALTSHGVGENLFTVDKDGNLVPELAQSTERTGELTWTIQLRTDRFFSDGTSVTAEALQAGFEHTFANNGAALATGGKLQFAAEDEFVLKVSTEKPVPVIQALFAEWPLIAYKPGPEEGTAIFSGPYEIAGFMADSVIDLDPNPHFEGADGREPVSLKRFGDAQAMAIALESGELDLAFGLPSESVARLKRNPDLTIKPFPVGYQYFAFLNTVRPALGETAVRQAVDLAFDREELAAAINGGTPATGAYAPYFPFAAKQTRMGDFAKAESLLDAAGWGKGADGFRRRDGAELRLLAITYPQRPDLVTMLPVIKAELARVGIALDTRIVDNISETAAGGDFDIALWAQHTAPSGDPAFFLNSMLRTGASLNHTKYASAEFDAIIDRFATTGDPDERVQIALDAQDKLFEDVPVSFLVSPVWYVGLSERMKNYEPWGSDYHVLRADIGQVR